MKRQDKGVYKNISIHESRHAQIASYGEKAESFDAILTRVLVVYEKYKNVYTKENKKK